MQAFARRHSKDSDAAACNRDSLADSCSSVTGRSYAALRQLPFALPADAMFGQSDGTDAGRTQLVNTQQVQLCIQNNSWCSLLFDAAVPSTPSALTNVALQSRLTQNPFPIPEFDACYATGHEEHPLTLQPSSCLMSP